MTLLSKSKYLLGIQCLKYFWISLHEKDRIPEVDLATQHKFDQGQVCEERRNCEGKKIIKNISQKHNVIKIINVNEKVD